MTNPNDCAFPADNKTHTDGGLTKREYFAAMAMQGLIANCYYGTGIAVDTHTNEAVVLADALITSLNKKP
jgi:hypothetical protein